MSGVEWSKVKWSEVIAVSSTAFYGAAREWSGVK